MKDEKEIAQDTKSTDRCARILIGIFNMIEFISGVCLLMFDTETTGGSLITGISFAMMILPAIYFFVLTIKTAKRK